MTHCSKPGCAHVASVVLSYDYGAQKVILEDAVGEISPHHYAMCLKCTEKLTPPRGWLVDDRRVTTPLFADRPVSIVPDSPFRDLSDYDEGGYEELEPAVDDERRLFFGSSA